MFDDWTEDAFDDGDDAFAEDAFDEELKPDPPLGNIGIK